MSRARRAAVALLCVGMAGSAARVAAATSLRTTTTTYEYNADGALAAVTVQSGSQAPATTYLTWDNFTPDAGTPTGGTVSAANGNLVGIGSSPGSASQFAYDVRDRLTTCNASGGAAASYTYHPASLLASSTLASGDVLQFFYDNQATPRMINTSQPATGATASFLGPVRYLSDGTEQILLTPRKDVAGLYDAAARTLAGYGYDPYGAPTDAAPALWASELGGTPDPRRTGSPAPPRLAAPPSRTAARPHADTVYELTANPFQYTGEYRDPSCDAYYLRARWYLPAHHTFLSRDPVDPLHRYGYAGGNPIGRVDPTGLSYESFSRSVERFLRPLTHGPLGMTLPTIPLYGQVVGGLMLSANLPQFWHHPTTLTWLDYGMLLSSVAVDGFDEHPIFDAVFGGEAAFRGRVAADVMLGAGQTALAGDRGRGRWDVSAMIQSAEYSASSIVSARAVEGFGYRPFAETTDDVSRRAQTHFANGAHPNEMLVYRVRLDQGTFGTRWTSPLREWLSIGGYHESVVAVAEEWSVSTEISVEDRGSFLSAKELTRWNTRSEKSPLPYMRAKQMQFEGSYDVADVERAFGLSRAAADPESRYNQSWTGSESTAVYKFGQFSNNCHRYAARVIANLGQ